MLSVLDQSGQLTTNGGIGHPSGVLTLAGELTIKVIIKGGGQPIGFNLRPKQTFAIVILMADLLRRANIRCCLGQQFCQRGRKPINHTEGLALSINSLANLLARRIVMPLGDITFAIHRRNGLTIIIIKLPGQAIRLRLNINKG